MDKPLNGIRVLEYGEGVAAPACAKYLADLGAEVIKVERPGRGDVARRIGPFYQDRPDPECSALFLYLNTNKLGVTLDPSTATGRELFLKLVSDSDALIENHPPGFMDSLGMGYSALKAINPMLVMTSITPFGQTGPYRDYKGSDLIAFHMGGVGMDTPDEVDDPSRQPPLRGGGYQASFLTAITAGIMTMAMLIGRHADGEGAYLDISEYEALADNERHRIAQYSVDEVVPSRSLAESKKPGRFGTGGLQRCKDGYVQFHVVERHMWRALADLMGKPEWADNERYADRISRSANWHEVEPAIRAYTMAHTKAEIASACQSRRVPCAGVNLPEDLLASDHLKERGFFVEVTHPATGELTYPGIPATLIGGAWSVNRPAPLLGQHNEDVFAGRLGYSKEVLVKLREAGVI